VGFAIPVNTAKRVIPQLIQYGEVRRPKLGGELRSVKEVQARFPNVRLPVSQGLLVLRITPGGAAERSGLQGITDDGTIGDIIVSGDGQELNDMDDLYRLLDKAADRTDGPTPS
jgi:S1-C subfamily serine protease